MLSIADACVKPCARLAQRLDETLQRGLRAVGQYMYVKPGHVQPVASPT